MKFNDREAENNNLDVKKRSRMRSAKSYYDSLIPPSSTLDTGLALFDIKLYADESEVNDLPEKYNLTQVVLLPKDPSTLYAYWEIDESDINVLKQQMGEKAKNANYTLRIYDVTYIEFNGSNANYWFDLDELFMSHRYVDVPHDDAVYVAEIGLRSEFGEFFRLARSNYVKTPRARLSSRTDLIWKEMEEKKLKSSLFVNVKLLNRNVRSRLKSRANWQNDYSRITLSADSLAVFYSKHTNIIKLLMQRNDIRQEALLQALREGRIQLEPSVIPEIMKEMIAQTRYIGASEEILQHKKKNYFPFEIEMELIVRGKTEPGADVYLGNKKIDVQHDGTFTLKWKLNDGALPLDFRAYSPQKDLGKSISTSVIRTITFEENK